MPQTHEVYLPNKCSRPQTLFACHVSKCLQGASLSPSCIHLKEHHVNTGGDMLTDLCLCLRCTDTLYQLLYLKINKNIDQNIIKKQYWNCAHLRCTISVVNLAPVTGSIIVAWILLSWGNGGWMVTVQSVVACEVKCLQQKHFCQSWERLRKLLINKSCLALKSTLWSYDLQKQMRPTATRLAISFSNSYS